MTVSQLPPELTDYIDRFFRQFGGSNNQPTDIVFTYDERGPSHHIRLPRQPQRRRRHDSTT